MTQLLLKTQTTAYYMTLNVNRLLYSQLFSNATWVATFVSLASGQTDPDSGTEAFTLTAAGANATLNQTVTLPAESKNYVFSLYVKRKTGTGTVSLTINGSTYTAITITGSWSRFDVTAVLSSTAVCGVKVTTSGDEVYVAWGQLEEGILPTAYLTNTANRYTVTQIVDADYPPNTVRGCAFLDGRFFVMTPSGEIAQSALEDAATWSALEYIQSQNDPGKGVFLAKIQNYLAAFKDWSTEFFYDAGNATGSILAPVQNASFQIGCASAGSVQELAGTVVWMGQTRDGFGRGIFQLEGQTPKKLSTNQVDKVLNNDSLASVFSWSANVGSHLLYGITLVATQVTLVYDFTSQLWSVFTSLASSGSDKVVSTISSLGVVTTTTPHGYSDGDIVLIASTNSDFNGWHIAIDVTSTTFQIQAEGTTFTGSGTATKHTETYFPITTSVRANGKQYMQHATNGELYELSQNSYIDAIGAIAARIRTAKIDAENASLKFLGQAELIGDKIASTAILRYTDDDFVTYSSGKRIDLQANRSRVRRLGSFNRRSFEVLHVGNALLRLEAIELL